MSRAKLISCVATTIVIPPSASSRISWSTSLTSSGSSAHGLPAESPKDFRRALQRLSKAFSPRRKSWRMRRTAGNAASAGITGSQKLNAR
jgi:hypothetical protein